MLSETLSLEVVESELGAVKLVVPDGLLGLLTVLSNGIVPAVETDRAVLASEVLVQERVVFGGEGSDRVFKIDVLWFAGHHALPGSRRPGGLESSGSTTGEHLGFGVGTDDGDFALLDRQNLILVLEKRNTRGDDLADQLRVALFVVPSSDLFLLLGVNEVRRSLCHPLDPLEHSRHEYVDLSRVDLVNLDEVVKVLLLSPSRWSRELEIKTSVQRLAGRVRPVPVRHDQAVVSPFLAQNALEQLGVLGDVRPIDLEVSDHVPPQSKKADLVVGRHDGPWLG